MRPCPDREAAVSELVYREASSAFAQQHALIDNLRARAGVLLSAGAVAASVFGGQALDDRAAGVWSWLALPSFVGLGAATVTILWPRGDVVSGPRPQNLIASYVDSLPRPPAAAVYRDLAIHLDRAFLANERRIARLLARFRAASMLLIAEVLWWVVDLLSAV